MVACLIVRISWGGCLYLWGESNRSKRPGWSQTYPDDKVVLTVSLGNDPKTHAGQMIETNKGDCLCKGTSGVLGGPFRELHWWGTVYSTIMVLTDGENFRKRCQCSSKGCCLKLGTSTMKVLWRTAPLECGKRFLVHWSYQPCFFLSPWWAGAPPEETQW